MGKPTVVWVFTEDRDAQTATLKSISGTEPAKYFGDVYQNTYGLFVVRTATFLISPQKHESFDLAVDILWAMRTGATHHYECECDDCWR